MGCPIIVRLPDPIWLLISTFDTHLALASNKQEERKGQITYFTLLKKKKMSQTDFKTEFILFDLRTNSYNLNSNVSSVMMMMWGFMSSDVGLTY